MNAVSPDEVAAICRGRRYEIERHEDFVRVASDGKHMTMKRGE
jgi:hypothetical protein